MIAKLSVGPGRPRGFDPETALEIGQRLFHARSYDEVGLAALTDAIGIKPPSFYKAFGCKAAFFGRILDRYARSVLVLDAILLPGRPPAEALTAMLTSAASLYARDPQRRGCLVLETIRGSDAEGATLARQTVARRDAQIRGFVAATHPGVADTVTDYVASTMSGLSASAREGLDERRMARIANAATVGLISLLAPLEN